MIKTNFTRKAVVASAAAIAVVAGFTAFNAYGVGATLDPTPNPADPYCLELTADPTGSIAGAGYIGEAYYYDSDKVSHSKGIFGFDLTIEKVTVEVYDDAGNYTGTREEDKITNVTLKGMKTANGEENIYLPDEITIDYTGNGGWLNCDLTDLTFNYYTPEQGNTESNTFIDSPELKHVYVGAPVTSVTWNGEDFLKLRNFHFRSPEVPDFHFNNGANGTINIYVPDKYFAHYTTVIEGADYTATVWSEDPLKPTYVNVDVPGTLADAISSNIDNLNEVRWLVVTGNPNEQDLRMMRRLPRLEILDLSATTGLTTIVGCNGLRYLREVKFPDGITSIGEEAFKDCKALEEMTIPASVKEIKSEAFAKSTIREINLENVETIGNNAFEFTNLRSINLANAKRINFYAFNYNHSLTEVKFQLIEKIDYMAFASCDIRELILPDSFSEFGDRAFELNYNLKDVKIGSGYRAGGGSDGVFRDCHVKNVICKTLFPSSVSGFDKSDLSEATLYVPALTLNEYLLADGWSKFQNVKPIEEDLTDITIDRTFMLTSDRGIAKGANLSVIREDYSKYESKGYGHLSVRRNINAPLNLGKYYQEGQKYLSEWWDNNDYIRDYRYNGATLIPYSEMTADAVELKLTLRTGRWHFISLPFDVNVSDIKTTDEALWVVRKYSGADHAALKETTWQNMLEGDVLKAGEGYIFHCAHDNTSDVDFTFKPASKEEGNKLFAKDAVAKQLAEYPAEFDHNASWNLVGNTYPAFLNIHALGFEAPITVYNGSSYIAYSPADDDLVLNPFQAFFVQRQDVDGGDAIVLNPEGRAHSQEEASALSIERKIGPALNSASTRALFNINIAGEAGSDRARVVVNENASLAYEKNCDASKFMSSEKEVPQIFVMNGNRRMAIDERPLGEGEIKLGASFGKSGEYTISLDTRNAEDYAVLLIDNKTGVTTDLTACDYTFEADATIDENRFTLKLNASTNAAEAIAAEAVSVSVDGNILSIVAPEEIEIAVVAADGKQVAAGRTASFTAVLEKGIYVVKAGELTKKVIVTQ